MRIPLVASLLLVLPSGLVAQDGRGSTPPAEPAPPGYGDPFKARPLGTGAVKVGPPRGTVIAVGGGSMGPEVYRAFIEAAGGPDALILTVPNAGGQDSVGPNAGQAWRNAGARNVRVLFTKDRRVADSDSFVTPIRQAGGIWFDGGRQFRLVQDYAGTKTEREFMAVLERGGVVGGSSAGASILGDFMVRGAPSNNNMIMAYPGYERGFGYLRNVGVDQHVIARSRLPDLADSIITRYPDLLAISVDEGTAWVIRGDTGRIVGRSKAFAYNGRDANDPDSPFLTLRGGDRYDLNARRIINRPADRTTLTPEFVRTMFAPYDDPARGGATVLVARDGDVLVNAAFGIGPQERHQPRTTQPQFELGDIARVFTALCDQLPAPTAGRGGGGGGGGRAGAGTPPTPLQSCVSRVSSPVGARLTAARDSTRVESNVDELYRIALGLEVPTTWRNADYTAGWTADQYRGVTRYSAFATANGRRAAFVRVPEHRLTIAVLTNDANADARGMAEQLLARVFEAQSPSPTTPARSTRAPS